MQEFYEQQTPYKPYHPMQQKAMASEHNTRRSVNFDLLKVMAMFSIIVIHYYSHYVFKVHPYFAVSTDYLILLSGKTQKSINIFLEAP